MKFTDFLNENKSGLSDDDKEILGYLIHNKMHITDGGKVEAIENALKYESSKITKPLYRGVSEKELAYIKNGNKFNQYQSFSEDIKIAKRYGKVVTLITNKSAFALWKWGIEELKRIKREDSDGYDMMDGDFLVDSYEEEKEWIMPFGTLYKVIDEEKNIFEIQ